MVTIEWTEGRGWHDAQLVPYGPLQLDPATMALHYGQEIFEGLKAYARSDGSIATFRPEMNAERFQRSAARLAMPALARGACLLRPLAALVQQDKAWVPTEPEMSLYLRPFMFSAEVGLGVKPSNSYLFLLIASPAGAYFSGGIKPVSVWLSTEYVRAAPGGTGEAKCAGNYAASLIAQAQAAAEGCDQVVWLDAIERRWIEEMGGMNLYFVYGSGDSARLVTPTLTGALLPGVTRDSLITVANDLGIAASEATDQRRRVARGECRRFDHRGLCLRHGSGHHADRAREVSDIVLAGGRWSAGASHRATARSSAEVAARRDRRCPRVDASTRAIVSDALRRHAHPFVIADLLRGAHLLHRTTPGVALRDRATATGAGSCGSGRVLPGLG